jgi:hypothetical protein
MAPVLGLPRADPRRILTAAGPTTSRSASGINEDPKSGPQPGPSRCRPHGRTALIDHQGQAAPPGRTHDRGRDRGAGSIHDLTQVRQAGLVELLTFTPGVTLLADAGYQGLSTQTAGAVITPRPARGKNQIPVFPAVAAAHEAEPRAHAAQRIRVELGSSHRMTWRARSRHLGRGEHLATLLRAVAGLVRGRVRRVRSTGTGRTTRTRSGGCPIGWGGSTR